LYRDVFGRFPGQDYHGEDCRKVAARVRLRDRAGFDGWRNILCIQEISMAPHRLAPGGRLEHPSAISLPATKCGA
jgi:hypothetical protein